MHIVFIYYGFYPPQKIRKMRYARFLITVIGNSIAFTLLRMHTYEPQSCMVWKFLKSLFMLRSYDFAIKKNKNFQITHQIRRVSHLKFDHSYRWLFILINEICCNAMSIAPPADVSKYDVSLSVIVQWIKRM